MGYKEDKEAFVSHAQGGSVTRINAVSLVAVTSYALWTVAHRRYLAHLADDDPRVLVVEFALLVVPLLATLTVLSPHPYLVNVALALAATAIACLPARASLTPPLSPTLARRKDPPPRQHPATRARPFDKPFVTSYRAVMMVMTVLCILAVDFPAFPREFAKAETWGTSLMDLGVGSFVFSLGLVAALPFLRAVAPAPDAVPAPLQGYWRALARSARKSAPLVLLGLVRFAVVKGVDYPEHVTEYGVHWNFFFTLALLPVFGEAVARLAVGRAWDVHAAALAVALSHEFLLRAAGLQRWALEAPRTSLVSQNKEGLTSFPGYLAIYLLGLATGLYVLPPSPSFFRRAVRGHQKKAAAPTAKPGKCAEWLGSAGVWWWALFALARWATPGGVSRRLANLAYVLWTAAFNCTFLCLYLCVHLFLAAPPSSSLLSPAQTPTAAPRLFAAINRNGLAVFLLANLLTGLTNVTLETLYASDAVAFAVLGAYSAAVCGAAWVLRGRSVKLW